MVDTENLASAAVSRDILLAPVNDEPAGTDGSIGAIEDQEYVFVDSDFGFSDLEDGHGFSTVSFTQLPANGQLTLVGTGVLGDAGVPLTVSVNDINSGLLRYTPPANLHGFATTIQFAVSDDGPSGTGPNGEDHRNTDSSPLSLIHI